MATHTIIPLEAVEMVFIKAAGELGPGHVYMMVVKKITRGSIGPFLRYPDAETYHECSKG